MPPIIIIRVSSHLNKEIVKDSFSNIFSDKGFRSAHMLFLKITVPKNALSGNG